MKFDTGRVALVLDAHAPFIETRPGASRSELDGFFEEVTLTYLPLLERLQLLASLEIPYRLTMALSPTLLLMLSDSAFQIAFGHYLESRLRADLPQPLRDRTQKSADLWSQRYQGRIAGGFAALEAAGRLELLASTATRACLPLLAPTPGAVRGQIVNGVREHRRILGRAPRGFWLPGAAYVPGLEDNLVGAGLAHTFVEQGTLAAEGHPPALSLIGPSGLRLQGLDLSLSEEISSPEKGYPSVPVFFHAKGRTMPYDAHRARWIAAEQGRQFVESAQAAIIRFGHLSREPVVACALPARLLGTTWLEGIDWLESFLRATAAPTAIVRCATLSEPLRAIAEPTNAHAAIGSHQACGSFRAWIQPGNDWIYPHLHYAAECFHDVASAGLARDSTARRALMQAGRELLLAQSADLAEAILKQAPSATERFRSHLTHCHELLRQVAKRDVSGENLLALEARHRIVPALDPQTFLGDSEQPRLEFPGTSLSQ